MKKLFGRLMSSSRQIATWYASPTGVISALALLVVLGLSAAGFAGAAVWVLVAWLGALLPYKLTRERSERTRQGSVLSKRLGRTDRNVRRAQADLSVTQADLSVTQADLSVTQADLSMTPTIAELADWQEEVDRRSAALQAKVASLDQLGESLRLQRESTQSLHDQHASLRTDVDDRDASLRTHVATQILALVDDSVSLRTEVNADVATLKAELEHDVPARIRVIERRVNADVPALVALYALLDPKQTLPSFASWALSPPAALAIVESIFETDADLVVEAGSGSSTVVAALALAKQGHGRVLALEHDIAFAEKTRRELRRLGVESFAEVIVAPLVEQVVHTETYRWYALDSVTFDAPIDVLLVDGPPGLTGPLARYPAIPLLAEFLASDAVVFLDDVDRAEEQEIARRWSQQFGLGLALDFAGGQLGKGRFQR
jgi:predicted O-methyltransferase YrrM